MIAYEALASGWSLPNPGSYVMLWVILLEGWAWSGDALSLKFSSTSNNKIKETNKAYFYTDSP